MPVKLKSSQVQQNFGQAVDRALMENDVIVESYGTPRVAIVEYGRYRRLVEAERELLRARLQQASASASACPEEAHCSSKGTSTPTSGSGHVSSGHSGASGHVTSGQSGQSTSGQGVAGSDDPHAVRSTAAPSRMAIVSHTVRLLENFRVAIFSPFSRLLFDMRSSLCE